MAYDVGRGMIAAVTKNLAISELQEADAITHAPDANISILPLNVARQECDDSNQCAQTDDANRQALEKREDLLRLHFLAERPKSAHGRD